MEVEVCDLCRNKTPNRKFKVKMATKGRYESTAYGIGWRDVWNPYKKISICEDCAEKLFGIKSNKTIVKEMLRMLRGTNK